MSFQKQKQVRIHINKLNLAITEAIGKVCEESNYEISYAEINSSLADCLKSNLGYELKQIWQKTEEEE